MDSWGVLAQIVALLGTAMVLGLAAQHLRQNAVIGYLLAGVLLGPHALGIVESTATVRMLAELGVALLLFTIGLEFSLKRLRALGAKVALLGASQVALTAAVVYLAASYLGLKPQQALVVGVAVSLSSTAVVLRLLSERSELDSAHGRTGLGILLLQDLAVIPTMLLVSALAEARHGGDGLGDLAHGVLKGLGLVAAIYALMRWLLPGVMLRAASRGNRDIPVLLSVTVCLGCSWASHAAGLSPILGAFAAGIMLGESPLANQIRADVIPLRAAFLPLFFSSIGMLAAAPGWKDIVLVLPLVGAIVATKAALIVLVSLALRQRLTTAVRTGIMLSQIGEFSFVLLEAGFRQGLVDESVFQLLLSASVVTLLLTPFLIHYSGAIAGVAGAVVSRFRALASEAPAVRAHRMRDHIIVVGFGPAGQQAALDLRSHGAAVLVIDLNPSTAATTAPELPIKFGDATQPEILEHAGVSGARAVVVTAPDPLTARLIISQARKAAKLIPIISRGRYHIHQQSLMEAGSNGVVDEEMLVGKQLARETLAALGPQRATAESDPG